MPLQLQARIIINQGDSVNLLNFYKAIHKFAGEIRYIKSAYPEIEENFNYSYYNLMKGSV